MKLFFRIDLLEFEGKIVLSQMVISSSFRWKELEPFSLTLQRILCTDRGWICNGKGWGQERRKKPSNMSEQKEVIYTLRYHLMMPLVAHEKKEAQVHNAVVDPFPVGIYR